MTKVTKVQYKDGKAILKAAAKVVGEVDLSKTPDEEYDITVASTEFVSNKNVFETEHEDPEMILAAIVETYKDQALAQEDEEEEEVTQAGNIVSAKYRQQYGNKHGCGDILHETFSAYVKTEDGVSYEKMAKVKSDNNVVCKDGKNPGHTRMIIANCLRSRLNKNETISIGDQIITPEDYRKSREELGLKIFTPKPPKTKKEEVVEAA